MRKLTRDGQTCTWKTAGQFDSCFYICPFSILATGVRRYNRHTNEVFQYFSVQYFMSFLHDLTVAGAWLHHVPSTDVRDRRSKSSGVVVVPKNHLCQVHHLWTPTIHH